MSSLPEEGSMMDRLYPHYAIKGHVFCSFLALVLRKEFDRRLEEYGHEYEWAAIKQDLSALQETIIEENEKHMVIRSECQGLLQQNISIRWRGNFSYDKVKYNLNQLNVVPRIILNGLIICFY